MTGDEAAAKHRLNIGKVSVSQTAPTNISTGLFVVVQPTLRRQQQTEAEAGGRAAHSTKELA
jgi:hypothetical protein